MFRYNLQVILRTFKRFRSTFIINLIGLSTGLAGALLIYLWVLDELHFDKFHQLDSRLYQVMINEKNGDKVVTTEGTGGTVGDRLLKQVPEVEKSITTAPADWFQKFNITFNDNTVSAKGNFVGSDYFNVFSYKLIQGDKNEVLNNPGNVVVSRHLAEKLFQSAENAIGKVLQWKWQAFSKPCTITGVYEDMPHNSTYRFDFMLPFSAWKQIMPATEEQVTTTGPFTTFVVLKEGADPERFNSKMAGFLESNYKDVNSKMFIRKYSDAYLHGKYDNGIQVGGRIEYVRLFSLIAIFILLIACINFMNLSTARASTRMKEIGVRKALGASRYRLISQFMGESILIAFISMLLAILMVLLILPQFNIMSGKHLTLQLDLQLLLMIIGITLFTGIVSGSYPALYLSGFDPVATLKGKLISTSLGELWARRGLVIFQFTISVVFIVAVIIFYNQIRFIQSKNLGYNKDNVIYFEMEGRAMEGKDAFLAELKGVNGIENASSIQQKILMPSFMPSSNVQWDGKNDDNRIRFFELPVNYGLIETLGIQMAEGRAFSRDYGTDTSGVVLNQAAVKIMGLQDPVGKTIYIQKKATRVLGVAKNFHFNSLHEEIKPFIFRLSPDETMLVMARLKRGDETATIQRVTDFYRQYNPGYSFEFKFLDNDFQQQYAAERLVSDLSKYFAILAIVISCLGLFGLAAFTAERRIKEIAIRKVMGATEGNIIYLLSADFMRILLISILIAIPASYFFTRSWLNDFAYRITLSPWYFVGAACVAIVTAWLTIGLQTIKAARVNPLECMRDA
ncbi:ABC transporter permease [Chitinophaga oryzae]|uniref:ABC transporter permease n=1 Tax=Chitinophaga oryzae TaxID=2725414 RepID=A0ABX6LD92_9BACT|nr:ABC transporter permease [Chitinophaga oryzae]QJB38090.1 ABC transporter permease [Chitinophaga oryzae]